MRKFGLRILVFIIPAIGFIAISGILFFYKKIKVSTKFEQISGYEYLLMGDSQMQRINSSYFSGAACNIASSAEHYYFTYRKLLRLLENEDHNIRKIILGAAPHNFAPL